MFVGESGVGRILQRTCEVMAQNKVDDPTRVRGLGVIDLPTMQRYVNFHSSVTLDLFGSDVSSNAATFYTTGIKGRFEESRIQDDHVLKEQTYTVFDPADGRLAMREAPALNALNEKLRDDFVKDSIAGIGRWNRIIQKAGIDFQLTLPHKAFHRQIGPLAGLKVAPDGRVVSEAEWNANVAQWLPTAGDRAFVQSLMGRVVEPGRFANWIAPPAAGINKQPVNFEYVRFN
jgi:benzoyl-CoA 2,3-dioxygenase component B